jgi:ankyrin repeat protein
MLKIIQENNLETFRALIKSGESVNESLSGYLKIKHPHWEFITVEIHDCLPIHVACMLGRLDMVTLLVESGVDRTSKGSFGYYGTGNYNGVYYLYKETPAEVARRFGHEKIAHQVEV